MSTLLPTSSAGNAAATRLGLEDEGCPDPHKKLVLHLTYKQVQMLMASLESTIGLGGEARRLYLRKLKSQIAAQVLSAVLP